MHPASVGPPDVMMRTVEGGGGLGDADTEDETESTEGRAVVLEWHAHREGNGSVQAAAKHVARAPLRPGVGPRGSSSSTIDGSEGPWADRVDVDRPSARMADLHTSKGRYVFSLAVPRAGLTCRCRRFDYTFRAVSHLFSSTYEPSDELTIASLVTYLNAAMPPDKHEDFDTAEVTKAAMALQARGQFVLEGDVLRIKS